MATLPPTQEAGRGRVDGKHAAGQGRRFRDAFGDHAGTGADGGVGIGVAGQHQFLDRADVDQLLGVDHRRQVRQRHGAAGVAGAAAARDDGQAELDAVLDQRGDLLLGVRIEDDEGVFDAPVGGVGDVRDAGQPVEGDVVLARVSGQHLQCLLAQLGGFLEAALEAFTAVFAASTSFNTLSLPWRRLSISPRRWRRASISARRRSSLASRSSSR
jgi:hypothetical protein